MTSRKSGPVLGWDIGGVNTKAACVERRNGGPPGLRSASLPFEIQRNPAALVDTLLALARTLDWAAGWPHAVTMTAELSQAFRTKREGVGFVLDAVDTAFPSDLVRVFTVDGRFVSAAEARDRPLEIGASNWVATATLVAREVPDAILVDIGTTSTDIIPIAGGRVVARGRTDPARLLTGELLYTGAVRTPAEALVREVPLWDGLAAVSAEGFATTGDAHVWLGTLAPDDYTAPTADGRPVTREHAGERLARVVCGDRETLDEQAIARIAGTIAEAQVALVAAGLCRVHAAFPDAKAVVVTGLGDFIAVDAARRVGLEVIALADRLGAAARVAPAAAVGWLLAEQLGESE